MRKFSYADTGHGDPPPKKPPTENPNKVPVEPVEIEGIGGA